MTDEQKGIAIMEHLDAICSIMGVQTLTATANSMHNIMLEQREAIEKETGEAFGNDAYDDMLKSITSQVGLSIGNMMSAYQDTLIKTLSDEDKMKDLAAKTMEEIKNAKR